MLQGRTSSTDGDKSEEVTFAAFKSFGTHLDQEDFGVVVEELLQALEVPRLTFGGERHLVPTTRSNHNTKQSEERV